MLHAPRSVTWVRYQLVTHLFLFCLLLPTASTRAEITLPSFFGDGMVVQRGQPFELWGRADTGARIDVRVLGQSASTTAGEDGRWRVRFAAIKTNGAFEIEIASGTLRRVIRNAVLGDVWLCAGQSNMGVKVREAAGADGAIATAHQPLIRFFDTDGSKRPTSQPLDDIAGEWTACTPATAATFSAVGYYFGRALVEANKVPIGLIHISAGGMPIESFLEPDSAGALLPPAKLRPINLPSGELSGETASSYYNGMVHPFERFGCAGVLWYQGESNVDAGADYGKLLRGLIGGWRKRWGREDLPFILVQIANYHDRSSEPVQETGWALVREQQAMVSTDVRNTALVVTIDLGEADNIHPRNKHEVGRRASLAARRMLGGEDLIASGPAFRSLSLSADRRAATIRFDHAGDGLKVKASGVTGFAVRDMAGRWQHAEVEIAGAQVVVRARAGQPFTAVRYAWADNPAAPLYNSAGLPAVPFRIDR